MNCKQVQKAIAQLDQDDSISLTMQEHLDHCSDCQAVYEEFSRVSSCLSQLPKIEPTAEFSAAWKDRLRQEALKPTKTKQGFWSLITTPIMKPAYAMTLAAIFAVLITGIFITKINNFNQDPGNVALQLEEGATYELKIVDVGPRNKYVQKVIRNFRSVSEGGIVFSQREGAEDWAVFKGLTPEQLQGLKHDLEYVGAKVEIKKEQ
ncbi:MAG TPA: hypothetical protein PLZ08_04115 [Bacillota bacterium]|jgi:hypothetical protein|nr:hypothetical protein [Bacillota bacterium]HOL09402.1 hypothetical protein [Bacillota bacterium]HPO97126.1 hypothetical protein [Bacillota bacterium]